MAGVAEVGLGHLRSVTPNSVLPKICPADRNWQKKRSPRTNFSSKNGPPGPISFAKNGPTLPISVLFPRTKIGYTYTT